ncbi:MAG: ABC transporter ATP-binding protein [Hyphomicrobiales bacterium]
MSPDVAPRKDVRPGGDHSRARLDDRAALVRGGSGPKIRIRGLRKSFSGQVVLAGVDLDLAAGENLVLLGASGGGKTVLVKCVLGLMTPDAGSIVIDGLETVTLGSRERGKLMRTMGVMFQNSALFDSLPVWENVSFGLINVQGIPPGRAKAVAIEKLAAVGLTPDVAELLPSELSGGMQRRVALARAIVGNPEVLFLDDPTAGLDPIITTIIDDFILRTLKPANATALTITYDVQTARRIADRVAMLSDGRIIWEGPADALDRSGNPLVERFVRRP